MKIPVYLKTGELFAEVEDQEVLDYNALTFGHRFFTFVSGQRPHLNKFVEGKSREIRQNELRTSCYF